MVLSRPGANEALERSGNACRGPNWAAFRRGCACPSLRQRPVARARQSAGDVAGQQISPDIAVTRIDTARRIFAIELSEESRLGETKKSEERGTFKENPPGAHGQFLSEAIREDSCSMAPSHCRTGIIDCCPPV